MAGMQTSDSTLSSTNDFSSMLATGKVTSPVVYPKSKTSTFLYKTLFTKTGTTPPDQQTSGPGILGKPAGAHVVQDGNLSIETDDSDDSWEPHLFDPPPTYPGGAPVEFETDSTPEPSRGGPNIVRYLLLGAAGAGAGFAGAKITKSKHTALYAVAGGGLAVLTQYLIGLYSSRSMY